MDAEIATDFLQIERRQWMEAATAEIEELMKRKRQLEVRVNDLEKSRDYWRSMAVKWRKVADKFYSRHDNGRTCNLISVCWECKAYKEAANDEF